MTNVAKLPITQQYTLTEADVANLAAFVEGIARPDMNLVLAHTDTGVVWGQVRFDEQAKAKLRLAADGFSQAKASQQTLLERIQSRLQRETLWQLRVFGPGGEYFIWRDAMNTALFHARLIQDGPKTDDDTCINEEQWLSGKLGQRGIQGDGFTLLVEGKDGLVHAPPITNLGPVDRVALTVRHYIDYPDHCAVIGGSRLTGLTTVSE